jgi:hypothetical protein
MLVFCFIPQCNLTLYNGTTLIHRSSSLPSKFSWEWLQQSLMRYTDSSGQSKPSLIWWLEVKIHASDSCCGYGSSICSPREYPDLKFRLLLYELCHCDRRLTINANAPYQALMDSASQRVQLERDSSVGLYQAQCACAHQQTGGNLAVRFLLLVPGYSWRSMWASPPYPLHKMRVASYHDVPSLLVSSWYSIKPQSRSCIILSLPRQYLSQL